MPAYRLIVDWEVIESLDTLTAQQRLEVFAILRRFLQSPNADGDWRTRDAGGRDIEVKVFGRWQITYWLDSPVWELRVVEVRRISLS